MPAYADLNDLNATLPLPDFYWGAETKMVCISEAVRHTRDHAYAHHIQRLMVTGQIGITRSFRRRGKCTSAETDKACLWVDEHFSCRSFGKLNK
jgi:hypothetical protein